jgi:hypothetical protein
MHEATDRQSAKMAARAGRAGHRASVRTNGQPEVEPENGHQRAADPEPGVGRGREVVTDRTRSPAGWPLGTLVVAAFAAGTWILFKPLGLADPDHLAGCACGDQGLQLWFLAADRYAVVHHQLPLLSTRLDYPAGVNLMDNTSMVLLGVIASPLISAVGPVGAFVFLLRLAFVASATSCYLVLRRYVRSVIGAASGGALYGFSPYMIHHGADDLSLVFVPIPPIVFFLAQRARSPGRVGRRAGHGAVIGLLLVAQFFISSEIFVTTVLLAGIAAVVIETPGIPRHPVAGRTSSPPALAAAAAVVVILLGYPAWYAVAGPEHVVGPTQSATAGIDLLNVVWPATKQVVFARLTGWAGAALPQQGATAFIGLPLLAIAGWVVVAGRNRPHVRSAAVVGVSAWILALGPRLIVDGRTTSLPLPFAVLTHIPVAQDIVPARLFLYVYLAAGTVLASGVDMVINGAADGLVLVLPTGSYSDESTGVAESFLNGRATTAIPTDAVALAYPYPSFPASNAMIWQADAGLRFSLLGGYAVRPLADHHTTRQPALLPPNAVLDLLLISDRTASIPGLQPASPAEAEAALPRFVARYGVTTLFVDVSAPNANIVVSVFRSVYGPPHQYGRLDVWPDIRH